MASLPSRERILSKLRSSLEAKKMPIPYPEVENVKEELFKKPEGSLAEIYATAFNACGGRFVYCEDNADMVAKMLMLADNLNWLKIAVRDSHLVRLFGEYNMSLVHPDNGIDESAAAVSLCERLIARTGSTLYSSAQAYGRQLPICAPIHITVAYTSQLVWDWEAASDAILKKYNGHLPSMLSMTTGPSGTTAIENKLVLGGQGPKEVYTFLIEG